MKGTVRIYEVGPRDGLQNEQALIPTASKIALIDALSDAGLRCIEATSFVSPKWVPQLADAADVLAGIQRKPGTRYAALTPNLRGFEAALAAGVDEVAVFAAASETFSRRNINCSIAESLERFEPVFAAAAVAGLPVRGYVSCVVECPYEGAIAPGAVLAVSEALLAAGCYEISLGDTIGKGDAESVSRLLDTVLQHIPADSIAGHFHDTGGNALGNVAAALDRGIRVFDTSIGGLGGCPYAPGARGNVATGDVVRMLETDGWETGVNLDRLASAEILARSIVSH